MQAALEEVRDIFSIMHDGCITSYEGDKSCLRLRIDCEYLAERIDASYTSFLVELRGIKSIELEPWMNPIDLPQALYSELPEIFQAEWELSSAEIIADSVSIVFLQHNPRYNFSGGKMKLQCESAQVFDEGGRKLTIDELDKICCEYWNEFSQRTASNLPD